MLPARPARMRAAIAAIAAKARASGAVHSQAGAGHTRGVAAALAMQLSGWVLWSEGSTLGVPPLCRHRSGAAAVQPKHASPRAAPIDNTLVRCCATYPTCSGCCRAACAA